MIMTKTCNDKGGYDKKLHMIVSFIIASVIGTVLAHIPPHNPWIVSACAFALAMSVGIGKEFYDRHKYGHFCIWDIVADAIGAAGGVVLTWLAAYFLSV